VRYAIITFGCRVNQADSLRIEENLRARGGVDSSSSEADLVIVNTCSVTSTADQGARQTIRRIGRENPAAKVIVTGCYATRRPDEIEAIPNVLRVIRNDEKDHLVEMLEIAQAPIPPETLTTAQRFGDGDGACGSALEPGIAGRTAFTLRVQTGCEERCAYCIIPSTRGRGRSVPIPAVVHEVERIARSGFKEIALTGVHLGSYGRDLTPQAALIDLLRALDRLDLDVSYRISSLEPMDCTTEIVDLVASRAGRFAPHFHLPLQHASDRMLVSMRRPYTLAYYRNLVDRIAERLPDASIGSDMIVGFPGESAEDFEANLAYLPESPLSHLHVFPYSDRPETEAASMGDRVPGPVVRERASELRDIGARLGRRFKERQLGTVRPALTLEDGTLAVTDNYLKVRIAPGLTRNQRVRVLIDRVGDTLRGQAVSA
jgi:threonylcarbamoyladenosine tRNA methylthiotransferase MtaB